MSLPTSVHEFLARRVTMGRDPWRAATLVLHALMTRERKPTLGDTLLLLSVTEPRTMRVPKIPRKRLGKRKRHRGKRSLARLKRQRKLGIGSATYKGWRLGKAERRRLVRLVKRPDCLRSFAKGSRPDHDYRIDANKVTITFRRRDTGSGSIASGKFRVFVCSTGRDDCTPLWMVRNSRGLWKAATMATLAGSCKTSKGRTHPAVADL